MENKEYTIVSDGKVSYEIHERIFVEYIGSIGLPKIVMPQDRKIENRNLKLPTFQGYVSWLEKKYLGRDG